MHSQPAVVLVVEDEWLIRATIVEVLTTAGFNVLEAGQGDTALLTLQQGAPTVDVLFTDIRMPGKMDGLELARRARELSPRIAVLVASGNMVPSRQDMPPGSLFLAKPYSYRELPGHVRAILGAAP